MVSSLKENSNKSIIFFDGYCNLCNGFINYCLDHDTNEIFFYAALDSKAAQNIIPEELIANYRKNPLEGTVFLWENERLYSRSEAAFRVFSRLNTIFRFLSIFRFLPKFITDSIYKLIARNRYKMFGKSESCRMPSLEIKSRFLD
jgi:predicted DCC family thiol-disulfide oxidoreductase YuxK